MPSLRPWAWLLACGVCVAAAAWPAVLAADPSDVRARLAKERRALDRAIKGADLDASRAAIDAIGKLDSPEGVQYLLSLAHVEPLDLYRATIEALAGSRSQAAREMLASVYEAEARQRNSNWERRVMLLDAFATLDGDASRRVFELAVDDPHPKVRLAAIRLLEEAGLRPEIAIPVWIDSLEASERAFDRGTPHVEARRHLFRNTAQDLEDASSWTEFWQRNGDAYRTPERLPEGAIRLGDSAAYYGETVTSRRVLFIVDTSASMNIFEHEGWPDTPQAGLGEVGGGGGTDGGGTTITNPQWKRWIELNPLSVRMDRAKAELVRLIEQLPAHTLFNIVAFNSRVVPWQKGLVPVQPQTIHSAKRFAQSLHQEGATAADLALATAFHDNHLADTVYFLSDGEPSRDGVTLLPVPDLLEQVDRANRFERIIINTLGFGAQGEPFMKALAERNRGAYRRIVGPPEWLAR